MTSQTSCVGQAEAPPRLAGQVLRQPLHEQQADAAEQADRRQQDLVGAPAGEDQGEVGRRAARRGRSARWTARPAERSGRGRRRSASRAAA